MTENTYISGFGNEQASEAISGALPTGRNSPQKPSFGLYTEQLSGTAFTVPRGENRRVWLYRLRPSAAHPPFRRIGDGMIGGPAGEPTPNRLRWSPLAAPREPVDLISGLLTLLEPPTATGGVAVLLYYDNNETNRIFCNSDGEMLIVPQAGRLRLQTELGRLVVSPGEIAVIPRGIRFRTGLPDGSARGYVAENRGAMLRLPDLGPIGANGLANPRDFLCPTAWFEDRDEPVELVQKFGNHLWATTLDHSPLDVVAWHGNLVPYKYDLARFNTIGTVSFDHPDPSIFTVLTSPSPDRGTANMDFVIFPPRWMVAEDTFRPPWFHRNVMNECMGLVHGAYDAKQGGFLPGGLSLHPMMSAHGPDLATTRRAMEAELTPQKLDNTLAFMFETREPLVPTRRALALPELQADYDQVWGGLGKMFTGKFA